MDFKKFENEDVEKQVPMNGEPFILIKSKGTIPEKTKQKLFVLGIVQVINGLLLILFNIVGIILVGSQFTMSVAPGIWMGIFVIVCGVFGILCKIKKSKGYIITYMILSILTAVLMWFLIGIANTGVILDIRLRSYHRYYYGEAGLAFNVLLSIFGVFEMVFAIVASAFGCGATCCDSQSTQYIPVQMNKQTQNVVFENLSSQILAKDQQGFYQKANAAPHHNGVIVQPSVIIR